MNLSIKDPRLTEASALTLQAQDKPFVTLKWDGTVVIAPEYQGRMDEVARLFWEAIAKAHPGCNAPTSAGKQHAELVQRFDLIIKGAYALNQEAHCYDHQPAVFDLLSEQTTLLRNAIAELETMEADTPKPAEAPAACAVDWRDLATGLPDDCETVLVACDDGEVDAAFYLSAKRKWVWTTQHPVKRKVIAWCPMPPPPAAKGVKS